MTLSTLTRAYLAHDLGADLHRWARRFAAVCAVVFVAGLAAGDAIHWANERLVGRGRPQWLAPAKPQPVALLAPALPALYVQQTGRVRPAPSGIPVLESVLLHGLTVPQLRREAARRGLSRDLYSKGRRAELLQALGAS